MWYAASLLFKGSRSPASDVAPLWQESVRLISASSEDEARTKAQRLGHAELVTYEVGDGTLTWVFDQIERIHAIDELALVDGTEVFSRFLRDTEVASLLTPFNGD
jgi:hypothetical protein